MHFCKAQSGDNAYFRLIDNFFHVGKVRQSAVAHLGRKYLLTPHLDALVEVHFQWRPQVRDPSDEMVLEAAINGRAEALVTYNIKHFALAGDRFKVPIILPAEFLRR